MSETPVFTYDAKDVFAVVDGDGAPRAPNNGEALVWTSEMQQALAGGGRFSKVAFKAHKNGSNQSISASTETLVTFGTKAFEEYSTDPYYDTATSIYTPPAGIYVFIVGLQFSSGIGDQSIFSARLYEDAAIISRRESAGAGTGPQGLVGVFFVETDGTHGYCVKAYAEGAGSKTIDGAITSTFFAAYKIDGIKGEEGDAGATGPNVGLDYTFKTATSGDPGSGSVLVNNATPASITQINISETNAQGASQSAFLALQDDSNASSKCFVRILDVADPGTNFIELAITGSLTDFGGYDTFPVSYVGHAGTIANDAVVAVVFFRTGNDGANGVDGNSAGIKFLFATSTSMADPSSGNVRLNNATLASVTAMAISANCAESGNPSVRAWINTFDDSTTTAHRGVLTIKKVGAPQNFATYDVTAALTDNTTWLQLTLAYLTGNGSFSASDPITVSFDRTGDKGASGSGSGDMLAANNLSDVASVVTARANLGVATPPALCDGRLTLTTAVPVTTSDVSGATTLYYTPYIGSKIALYDGSTAWNEIDFSEISIKATDVQNGNTHTSTTIDNLTDTSQLVVGMAVTGSGVQANTTISAIPTSTSVTLNQATTTSLTGTAITFKLIASTNYDVFAYASGSTAKLEFGPAWTNATTRATAITQQNGVDVKSGATTRRLLGTIRTTSAGTLEDSVANRFVSNHDNTVPRPMIRAESTNSWNYSSATYRQANGSTANQLNYVATVSRAVRARAITAGNTSSSSPSNLGAGIGIDSTSTDSAQIKVAAVTTLANIPAPGWAEYYGYPGIGYHAIVWLEFSNSGGTVSLIGTGGQVFWSTGIIGEIWN